MISNSLQENLKMYKSATFTLMLLSKLENSDIVSVSTNLISTDLFNPSGYIFLINTERAVAYLNKTFLVKRVTLNDVYIDGIHFDFEFRVTKNKTLILPDILDLQICIDFYESWKLNFESSVTTNFNYQEIEKHIWNLKMAIRKVKAKLRSIQSQNQNHKNQSKREMLNKFCFGNA